ncbi:MAG: glycosyltransferase family 4 protein [Crocinitomicaceae bacterium]|nr:glycosyltransferase family 4 protein [Crocinitomicaceae bacterium]
MEGFGWFTFETMRRIVLQHPEHEFIFFFDRPFDKSFLFSDNITPVVVSPPARHPILFRIWFDYSLPRVFKKYKCEAFISPDGYLSLQTKIPQLAVIHDLNFEHNPEDLPIFYRKYYKTFFPKFAKKAARIVTVSEFSKEDIEKKYGIPSRKIDVVYNGVSDVFQPIGKLEKKNVQQTYTAGNPYLLFVGALHKRKNLQRLIDAYFELRQEKRIQHHLLIVGETMWGSQTIKIHQELKRFVHFTGHLDTLNLAKVTASADMLCFVSYFEGFGIPVLEAMRSGVPVLAGSLTALPEIGGDAAFYCDPYSVESIKEGILQVLDDQILRCAMIEKGLIRADSFSWNNTAKGLWCSFERMMNL